MPENEEAYSIFQRVRSQLIFSFGGPVDLDHVAIHKAMELYNVEYQQECFDKVTELGRWWLNKISDRKGDK